MDTEYVYGLRNRPPMYGTCPEGYLRLEARRDYQFEVAIYDHKLTSDEEYRFEMFPISANAYDFQVGDAVIVVETEEQGVITQQLHNHRYVVHFGNVPMIWGNKELVKLD